MAKLGGWTTGLKALLLLWLAILAPAMANATSLYEQPKYAAILMDANTHEVLYARRADELRYPASITKVMTLYLAFEAIEAGKLKLTDRVPISRHAAAQAPSKLGLRAGSSLSVDEAIRVIAVKSANDIAVALGEKLAGTETAFAAKMTAKAHQLGMKNTHFVNASGLPAPKHLTTARDIAIMSMAMIRNFPHYYSYFSQQSYSWGKQTLTNHNHLLGKLPGVDGIKTGFTNAAGFTLAASAVRNGRRLVAVVLGGPSTAARDANVTALINAGFDVINQRTRGQRTTVAANLNEPAMELPARGYALAIEQGSGDDRVVGSGGKLLQH